MSRLTRWRATLSAGSKTSFNTQARFASRWCAKRAWWNLRSKKQTTPKKSESSLQTEADYLPSVSAEGKPDSQPFGEFQGRADTFWSSGVPQPVRPALTPTRARIRMNLANTLFIQ